METTNTFYPVFEPDQVLTSEHLNQLRRYLAAQDRKSRRLLHGIGVVWGLFVSNPKQDEISISKGVGITSMGYLICLEQADCKFYRPYKDKVFTEVNCEMQIDGKYDLFLDENNKQYDLWELLTAEEEAEIKDPQIKPLDKAKNFLKMDDMYVMLYLEIEDVNLMACFGDDCDEKGIQRNFTVRKLMVRKDDLIEIIKEANSLDNQVTEEELTKEINSKFNLKEISIKRLGYDFSAKAVTLSLKDYYDFDTLFDNYTSVIKQAIFDVGKALYASYETYQLVLNTTFPTNPFKDFDSDNLQQNPLFSLLANAIKKNRYSIQYIYDFVVDLIQAYYEFKRIAFEMVSVGCPNKNLFPRHLMLGKAIEEVSEKPTIFRHYFIPAPASVRQNDPAEKISFTFQKIVKMIDDFDVNMLDLKDIRFTPSPPYAFPLNKRAIPFYYKMSAQNGLNKNWNYKNYSQFRTRMELSYHADFYNTNSDEEFVSKPALWYYNQFDFLRVEGHVGKKYETAIANILSLQERLNLPVKIIGLKLSRRFDNTTMTVECQFDDLQNLYRTFITELRCMLVEEAEFFRNLETEPKGRGKDTSKTGKDTVLDLLKATAVKTTEAEKLTSGMRINTNLYSGKEPILSGMIYNYDATKEGTIGHLMDNVAPGSGQTVYTSILNLYASGKFNFLYPGIFIYTILYPVQLASDIDNLLKNIPESLEEFTVDVLKKDFSTLIETAKGFKKSILENLAEQEYQRIGNEEVILYRLDKLIYHCSIRKLLELYKVYLARIEEVKQLNLFARFAKDHPGMEHMAGVPKGGTFVLVYIDTNETVDFIPDKGIREIDSLPDFQTRTKGFKVVSNEMKINLSSGFSRGIDKEIEEIQRPNIGRDQDGVANNIVVADFALPYLCMGNCPQIATMIVSQITFSLDKNIFCANDKQQYPFIIDPKGGKVKGPGVIALGADFYFVPAEANVDTEDVQFTYIVNNQTVVFNVKIYKPLADFEAMEPSFDNEGNVVIQFLNKSSVAEKFSWDFGDGQTSEERDPAHVYKDFSEKVAIVTLEALRGECSDLIRKEIKIPQQDKIVFDIVPKVFCGDDKQPYPFITEPKGGIVKGPGVEEINDQYFFIPAAVTDNGEDVTFTYTLPNGQSATLIVKVFHVQAGFNYKAYPFDPEIKGVRVEFFNTSTGAEKFFWDFGDGQTSDEVDPVHIYTNFDNSFTTVTLTAIRDNCFDKETIEIPLSGNQIITFDMEGKRTGCNNISRLAAFITVPEATKENPVKGPNVTESDGKYLFSPFGLDKGIYTFTYLSESLEYEVFESPIEEFDYTVEFGRMQAFVQFSFNGENISDILWDFGDGKSSKETNPQHTYIIANSRIFKVVVNVLNENNCSAKIVREINLDPEVDQKDKMKVQSLTNLSQQELSMQVFSNRNTLPNAMISYFSVVQKDINDPAIVKEYENSKKNDEIANNNSGFNKDITKAINKLAKDDQNLQTKQDFAFQFLIINLENLFELLSIIKSDISPSDSISSSFDLLVEIIKSLKKEQVNVDPDGNLSSILMNALKFFKAKTNLKNAIKVLQTAIK